MAQVVRNGDANTAGGVAQGGATTVFAENGNVMLPAQPVTGHGNGIHAGPQTQGGSSTVFCEGTKVIHTDDVDTCGHKRAEHAPTVYIGT